jgi:4-hydroxybenzoate polyprenyltransferase
LVAARGAMSKLADYLSLVKFEHSIFALPFVLSAAFIHAGGLPTAWQLGWMVVAAVSVRTAAMAFNRIIDRRLDALNPRTSERELPTGRVRVSKAWVLTVACSALFVASAAMLNRLCFALSLPALIVLLGYSYTKRFTAWCHAALGLSLGIAPMGAWLAVHPTFDYAPMVLSLAVICWVAGFDIIYALLDEAFDRAHGVHSAVVALGRRGALQVSSALHGAFLVLVALFGWLTGMGPAYYAAIGIVGVVVVVEHLIVSPDDLSRVNAAFFTANGVASLLVLVGVCLEVFR